MNPDANAQIVRIIGPLGKSLSKSCSRLVMRPVLNEQRWLTSFFSDYSIGVLCVDSCSDWE